MSQISADVGGCLARLFVSATVVPFRRQWLMRGQLIGWRITFCTLRAIALFPLLAFAQLATAPTAVAEFKVCNESALREIYVAYAYQNKNLSWISRGWWKVQQGSCAVVIDGPLSQQFIYTYAFGTRQDSATTKTTFSWYEKAENKGALFCINSRAAFALRREQHTKAGSLDCEGSKFVTKNFKEHDVKNTRTLNYILGR